MIENGISVGIRFLYLCRCRKTLLRKKYPTLFWILKKETKWTAIILNQDQNRPKSLKRTLLLITQYKTPAHFQGKPIFLATNQHIIITQRNDERNEIQLLKNKNKKTTCLSGGEDGFCCCCFAKNASTSECSGIRSVYLCKCRKVFVRAAPARGECPSSSRRRSRCVSNQEKQMPFPML